MLAVGAGGPTEKQIAGRLHQALAFNHALAVMAYPRFGFDWLGFSLISAALICVTYVLSQGSRWDWFEEPRILMLTMIGTDPAIAHMGSRKQLLVANASPERALELSPEKQVREGLSPVFLVHAADDKTVPVENTLAMFAALNPTNPGTAEQYRQRQPPTTHTIAIATGTITVPLARMMPPITAWKPNTCCTSCSGA